MSRPTTGSNDGDEMPPAFTPGQAAQVVQFAQDNSYLDMRTRLTGGTLKAVGKWVALALVGAGGVGSAVTIIQAQATMAAQIVVLTDDMKHVKEKADDTALAVARIEGVISPPNKPHRR